MPAESPTAGKPRTFFLNEKQELGSFENEGGGPGARYVPIDWVARSEGLATSFRHAVRTPSGSKDPSSTRHFFVVAVPVKSVQKQSSAKTAKEGVVQDAPAFGGAQSRLFRKLGMDLVETLPDGRATVHVPAVRTDQLVATMASLSGANSREKGRWINFERFEALEWTSRVSAKWIEALPAHAAVEAVIRFQPALTRVEVNDVLEALTRAIEGTPSRLTNMGREFCGRYWCAGLLLPERIRAIAIEFGSVQSIHPPLRSAVAARPKGKPVRAPASRVAVSQLPVAPIDDLPTVAIVDCGIPDAHVYLSPYRRSGFRNPNLQPWETYLGSHGSHVASCAVFGRLDMNEGTVPPPAGKCRVIDVMVGVEAGHVDDELVIPAMSAIVGTAPDVRVFNLSFGGRPLDLLDSIIQREQLMKLQDLDNFAFARDIVLVIAAGNSEPGVIPNHPYPDHLADSRWGLGALARSFNGLVCGSYVDKLTPEAVVGTLGAPSPFTRIGPGQCGSPVPGFSAPGGNGLDRYEAAPRTGLWVSNADGTWEDHAGTSLAAPLVAREAAWAVKELARRCAPGTSPFSATVKAWLHLLARRPPLPGAVETLAPRTLGKGFPSAERILAPAEGSAVFVWQTVLPAPKSVNRAQLPVPLEWLRKASAPALRVVCAWNTPVNIALVDSWACRKVMLKVRPFGGNEALRGTGKASGAYPLLERRYDLTPVALEQKRFIVSDAHWIFEVEYEEIGEYPPAMTISSQQRVGVVLELVDEGEVATSPQPFIQALPVAVDMLRLSALQQPIQPPVTIRP